MLLKVDYSLRFFNSVSNEFWKGKDHEDKIFVIPLNFLELSNYSYPLEYPSINSIKSNQKMFEKILTNTVMTLVRVVKLEAYNLYFL